MVDTRKGTQLHLVGSRSQWHGPKEAEGREWVKKEKWRHFKNDYKKREVQKDSNCLFEKRQRSWKENVEK